MQFEALLPVRSAPAEWRERVPWKGLQKLQRLGYTDFKIVNQAEISSYGRGPAFVGEDEWSGPIGEEAADTVTRYHWNTYDNVFERLQLWEEWQARTGKHAWLDIVARLNASRLCFDRPPSGASFVARCHRAACLSSRTLGQRHSDGGSSSTYL